MTICQQLNEQQKRHCRPQQDHLSPKEPPAFLENLFPTEGLSPSADPPPLWTSPDLFSSTSKEQRSPDERPRTPANQGAQFDDEDERDAALRRELEGVRKINEVIEGGAWGPSREPGATWV